MPIPDYQSLMAPILRIAGDGKEHPVADFRMQIAHRLRLSLEELAENLPGGGQTVFTNRVSWAAIYLSKACALSRTKRGVYQVTARGRELLQTNTSTITVKDLSRYPEFLEFKGSKPESVSASLGAPRADTTPDEQIGLSYRQLRSTLAIELLESIRRESPAFFERLVVDLLVAMGYGGAFEGAGQVLGHPGDGGIDGIIRQDKLALDTVYIQARRWDGCVGRPDLQRFAGSLAGHHVSKGVMITTSFYSKDAVEYVRTPGIKIALIDGPQLAELMIDHDIGVKVSRIYR